MPYFTIHVEQTFDIEANTVEEAMAKYDEAERNMSQPEFLASHQTADIYVTDEEGEEVA